MRFRLPDWFRPGPVLLVLSVLLVAPPTVHAQQPVAPAAEVPEQFKSTFNAEVIYGKDPFFPRSTRREGKVVAPVEVKPVILAVDGLTLGGISGANQQRLAIINNRTFAQGEENTVKIQGQNVNVKCVDIREDSVVVSVGGLTRELHFKKK